MMNRRQLISRLGLVAASSAFPISALSITPRPAPDLSGQIIAACRPYNTNKERISALGLLDLKTGKMRHITSELPHAHDMVMIEDQFLVIPNFPGADAWFTDAKANITTLPIRDGFAFTGHAFYDPVHQRLLVSCHDIKNHYKGYFAIVDPQKRQIIDWVPSHSAAPHDMHLIDEDTLAVCNYSLTDHFFTKQDSNLKLITHEDGSSLSFYNRHSLELKSTLPAYTAAATTHAALSNDGKLFTIGLQEASFPEAEENNVEHFKAMVREYYELYHPDQAGWGNASAELFKLHPYEKKFHEIGMPLMPLYTNAAMDDMNPIPISPLHRRAQSICNVKQTDTIVMSHPHTDSICLINASTLATRDLILRQYGIIEVRAICEIANTPYLAAAGAERNVVIIDTRDASVVKRYDVELGNTIHMHHVT